MKIFVDSNVLISVYFFGSKTFVELSKIFIKNELFTSAYSLNETGDVLIRKFGNTRDKWGKAIATMFDIIFECRFKILINSHPPKSLLETRDVKDDPIINCAIENNVDILLTGDRDLLEFKTNKIKILSPVELIKQSTSC